MILFQKICSYKFHFLQYAAVWTRLLGSTLAVTRLPSIHGTAFWMCFQLGNPSKFIFKFKKTPILLCHFDFSGHLETQSQLFLMLGVIQVGINKNHAQWKSFFFLNYPVLKCLCQKDRWYGRHTQGHASLKSNHDIHLLL